MSNTFCSLESVSDQDLLVQLKALVRQNQALSAALVAHLAEVDRRQLYLCEAAPSLFVYCVDVLHLSEDAAYKRIRVARAARLYPVIFELVANGELHLAAVHLLAPHLTQENHQELLSAARHQSKRQIERLVASRFPLPDVRCSLRKLPAPNPTSPPLAAVATAPASCQPAIRDLLAELPHHPAASATTTTPGCIPAATLEPTPTAQPPVVLGGEAKRSQGSPTPRQRALLSPLSEDGYRLQVTLRAATRDKLVRAQQLLRHKQPDGDVSAILDLALGELCDRLERQKFGKRKAPAPKPGPASDSKHPVTQLAPGPVQPETAAPSALPTSDDSAGVRTKANSRYIGRAVRRAVAERDHSQCTFVAPDGTRCACKEGLEYHHIVPFARGGVATVQNTTLLCRSHHQHQAVLDFGAGAVRRGIQARAHRRQDSRGASRLP